MSLQWLLPSAAVIVVTVRACKLHTGKFKVVPGKPLPEEMVKENPDDVIAGASNLRKQIENIKETWHQPRRLHQPVQQRLPERDRRHLPDLQRGGCPLRSVQPLGRRALAPPTWPAVVEAANEENNFNFLYDLNQPIKAKIEAIAKEIYGAAAVSYEAQAESQIRSYEKSGFGTLPICMAKTHLSSHRRPIAQRCADRLHATDSRSARQRRRRLYLPAGRRDAHHARSAQPPGGGTLDIDFATGRVVGLF